jgi:hypothetical protein
MHRTEEKSEVNIPIAPSRLDMSVILYRTAIGIVRIAIAMNVVNNRAMTVMKVVLTMITCSSSVFVERQAYNTLMSSSLVKVAV